MLRFLQLAFALSVLAVAACLCALLLTCRSTVADVPKQIDATRAALTEQIACARAAAIAEIHEQATGLRWDATTQINLLRRDTMEQIGGIRTLADRQLTGARADLQKSIGGLIDPIQGIRRDVATGIIDPMQPVLANAAALTANAAALTKDAQDSLDDLYPDVRGLTESATVATTQTAQTMQTIREVAPTVGRSVDTIAKSAALEAQKFTAPMSRRQKLMVWLELVPRVALKVF